MSVKINRTTHIVLRYPRETTGETAGGRGSKLPTVEFETAELSDRDRVSIANDPGTRAVADVMPLRLLEPTQKIEIGTRDDLNRADPLTSTGPTWGVQAVKADVSSFDGSGVVVAVLDTGIDAGHPAFQDPNLVIEQQDFSGAGNGDTDGHGTNCAGILFGRDVPVDGGTQRIGVARGVGRALIGKVVGGGGPTTLQLFQAINWAVREGAHVISMSLGFDYTTYVKQLIQGGYSEEVAASIALRSYRDNINLFNALAETIRAQGTLGQGTILVAAAGNKSSRPQYEIGVEPPAAATDIIAVGSLENDSASGYSVAYNSNSLVDVAAPGVGIITASPGGGVVSMSGTSMATPFAAGVAALWAERMLQVSGSVYPTALVSRLVGQATTDILSPGFQWEDVGTGIVQAPA